MKTSSDRSAQGRFGARTIDRRRVLLAAGAGLTVLGVAAISNRASAQSLGLDDARNQGLVGERLNGLIGVVRQAPGVDALVTSINEARMTRYREIAADTGAPLDAVQARAGQQLIERAQSGWFVESTAGAWIQVP